ncbi:MAG: 3-phosphoserine/phosphohydroxythreonine transaminase [Actinomycetota bacterium]|nr:3-phosphoserine/phosphohydroxythreonine transaminase [Actinomycetota bacterium]
MDRVVNFAAGPATLPVSVLQQIQRELVSLPGLGVSPLEISHRSTWFDEVIDEAEANLRVLLGVPDMHRIVFCQGGATQQFSMVPMNLLRGAGRSADYAVTGAWGAKAVHEAEKVGSVHIAWSGAGEGFIRVPNAREWEPSADAEYLHVTTNETIDGVQWTSPPTPPEGVPLVADMSSDFLSRPLDIGRFGLLYAGAQKNAGPAGVTIVIVREDLLERAPDGLPTMLDYRTFVQHGSRYNTPPVLAIYAAMLVTRWLRDEVGGLDEQERRNRAKAALVYDAIDSSGDFYRGHAQADSRSMMNVTFRLPSPELDAAFVTEAATHGLAELKGHRSIGGVRASLYNAMPVEGVEALVTFMQRFAASHH